MARTFNLAAKAGIASLAILFCLGIYVGACHYLLGMKHDGKWLIVPQVAGFFATLVWLICTILLWIEGWMFIAEGLRSRFWLATALLVLALIFFNILAAYIFHFVRRSRLLTSTTILKATV